MSAEQKTDIPAFYSSNRFPLNPSKWKSNSWSNSMLKFKTSKTGKFTHIYDLSEIDILKIYDRHYIMSSKSSSWVFYSNKEIDVRSHLRLDLNWKNRINYWIDGHSSLIHIFRNRHAGSCSYFFQNQFQTFLIILPSGP